jgi:hypothetical protein
MPAERRLQNNGKMLDRRPMKLVRIAGSFAALAVLSACTSSPAVRTASAPLTTTSAEWVSTETPRVGKAQRAEETEESPKEPRRSDKRPGGGFSGWK